MILLLALACTPEPFDPELADRLDAELALAMVRVGAPGAVVAVGVPDEGVFVRVDGVADIDEGRALEAGDRFRIGSVSKLFVAAVVHQLADEGVLSLDDPLGAWVTDYPDWSAITLRQLLAHTAGLDEYIFQGWVGNTDQPWTAEQLIDLVYDEPVLFAPGTDYRYANTHYVLLGMVVEAATSMPWRDAVRTRLLEPYGLDGINAPGDGEGPQLTTTGYTASNGDDLLPISDLVHPSAPGAAFEMVGSAEDLVAWAEALFAGDVLSPAQLAEMTAEQVTPQGATGQGLGPYIVPAADGARLIGHYGTTFGFRAQLRFNEDTGEVVVSLVNRGDVEVDELDAAAWGALGTTY